MSEFITQTSVHAELRTFLESDELRHITPLKMLAMFGDSLRIYRVDAANQHGYLLTMPRSRSQWASSKYPEAARIVIPALPFVASDSLLDEVAVCALRVTKERSFVVNTIEASLIARLQHANDPRAPLSLRLALLSFVPDFDLARDATYIELDDSVRCFAHVPVDARALLTAHNVYSDSDLATMFADGSARCWLRYAGNVPVALLLTFANSPSLHEIGSLHVDVTARRAGHAQALVRAALSDLRVRGLKVRYVTEATNAASIALASRSGLALALTTEHWVSKSGA
jgi:ribosomal protein S18 acetylase RimI-like enzyme